MESYKDALRQVIKVAAQDAFLVDVFCNYVPQGVQISAYFSRVAPMQVAFQSLNSTVSMNYLIFTGGVPCGTSIQLYNTGAAGGLGCGDGPGGGVGPRQAGELIWHLQALAVLVPR